MDALDSQKHIADPCPDGLVCALRVFAESAATTTSDG
jgi:hypothetical protein